MIWLMVYDVHDNGKAYKFQSISDPYYNPDLKFVVSGAQTDNAAPVVESIELDKTDVTVGDVVTITVKITDESGVKGTPSIGYYSDSSPTYTTILTKQGNDIYKGTIAITDQLANGEYYIQWLMVRDIYGNGKIYNFQYSDGPYYNPELVIRVQRYDHIWDQGVVTKKATCTEDGEKLYTCTTCQITKTETITATGHKEIKDPAVEPSCEIAGKTEGSHCSVCNTVLIPQDIIQATGHDWVAIVNKQERSCTEPVSIIYACSICQETKTEKKYVGGHHLYGLWKISSVATVFAPAQLTRECVGCGKAEKKNAGNKLQSTMKVSATAIPLKVKQTTTILKVTGLAKGDSIASWKSSNTKIATISGKTNGTCTIKAGKKTGKATITITLKSGLQKKVIVSVQKGAVQTKKITGIAKTLKLKKNQKAVLRPVVTPLTSTQKVTYKSSNSKVVAVNSKGQITAKKKGTATITVKSGGKSVKCKVTVK